jgi:predicted alpha/beta-fold hydrolase
MKFTGCFFGYLCARNNFSIKSKRMMEKTADRQKARRQAAGTLGDIKLEYSRLMNDNFLKIMYKIQGSIMKKISKMIGITLLSVTGILLTSLAVIAINSPGKLERLKDKEENVIAGSFAEKHFIEIGGIPQGFFLRSENPENPVILFLHGGPGSPELALLYRYEIPERLEKYFTVCYWDQRGAGMSFSNSIDTATMTLEQLIEDTRQITEYLKQRFKQEKIYLTRHSWGSFLGIKTVEKHPENYFAVVI